MSSHETDADLGSPIPLGQVKNFGFGPRILGSSHTNPLGLCLEEPTPSTAIKSGPNEKGESFGLWANPNSKAYKGKRNLEDYSSPRAETLPFPPHQEEGTLVRNAFAVLECPTTGEDEWLINEKVYAKCHSPRSLDVGKMRYDFFETPVLLSSPTVFGQTQ